ncbi:MAG: hypothetical protein LBC68_13755 [Prevotellaceae bacterium]|jgi:hypothetical protein|nr:hypothetical protein [Prevotellaceae bacterium]
MKKIFFYAVIFTVCFVSCNKDELIKESNEMLPEEKISEVDEIYMSDPAANTLRSFGKALYGAMSESPMLREIIKNEALKQFNKDYDVLYQFIKNEKIENGLTVRELLLKHFDDKEILMRIEARCPTLTIFVPKLPEDSFSAETWNIETQIPAVAIRAKHHNTPAISEYGFFDENSDEFVIEAGYIPAFPVVVLKQNERVRVARDRMQTQSAVLNKADNDFAFEFIDECFDGSKEENVVQRTVYSIDQKIKDAYNIYQNTDGWQRDYIYYGLTPTNTTGPFCYDYQEHITSFKFSPQVDPEVMMTAICDQTGDPTLIPVTFNTTTYPWTDGILEFRILAQTGSKAENTSELKRYLRVYPNELFEVTYTPMGKNPITGKPLFYMPTITGFKTKEDNIPLMNWDLENFSTVMKICIEEEDDTETTETTFSASSEFATNIEFNATYGETVKAGLKFGVSAKTTKTNTYKRSISRSSDDLGDVLINFADKIILSESPPRRILGIPIPAGWNIREYDSNQFVITVVPVRVQ